MTKDTISNKRIGWIDSAKGICMISVVVGHVANARYHFVDLHFVYAFHLIVFFIVSGYFIKEQKVSINSTNKLFSRLMCPYFITCFFLMLMNIINLRIINQTLSLKSVTSVIANDIIKSFFASGSITSFAGIQMNGAIGAIWFLPAIFFSQILYQLVCSSFKCERDRLVVFISVAALAYISSFFIWLPFSIQTGAFASMYLFLGHEAKEHGCFESIRWYHYLLAFVVFIIGIKYGFHNTLLVVLYFDNIVLSNIVAISGAILVFGVARISQNSKVLTFIGRNSLAFLCLHLFTLNTLGFYINGFLHKLGFNESFAFWNELVLLLELVLPLGALFIWKSYISPIVAYAKSYPYAEREYSISRISLGIITGMGLLVVRKIDIQMSNALKMIVIPGIVFFVGFEDSFLLENSYEKKPSFERIFKVFKREALDYIFPYAFFVVISIAQATVGKTKENILKVLLSAITGLTYRSKWINHIDSVDEAGVLLLIVSILVLAVLLLGITGWNQNTAVVVLLLFCLGSYFGRKRIVLPWSIDLALYLLLFYLTGMAIHTSGFVKKIASVYSIYFVLSVCYIGSCYKVAMTYLSRENMADGISVICGLSGCMLFIMLSDYIRRNHKKLSFVLEVVGKYAPWILVVYCVFDQILAKWLSPVFTGHGFSFTVILIALEAFIGVLIGYFATRCVAWLTWKDIKV